MEVAMGGDEDVVRAMLQRFSRAITTGDGPAAAACWDVPALVVSDEGNRAVGSAAEVETFFGGAKEQYNQQGVADTRPEVECIEWHSDRLASVTVRWPYLDAEGKELGRSERSVYLVRVTNQEARICMAATLGAE
jgi:hypothetical protein